MMENTRNSLNESINIVCSFCTERSDFACQQCPVQATVRKLNLKAESNKPDSNNIKNATFVSVWDGGTQISSPCKVNLVTREIIEISPVENDDLTECVESLDYECVIIDGCDYRAVEIGVDEDEEEPECGPNDFWYTY